MADYEWHFWKSAELSVPSWTGCPLKHQIKIDQLIFTEFLSLKNFLPKYLDNALVGLLKLREH